MLCQCPYLHGVLVFLLLLAGQSRAIPLTMSNTGNVDLSGISLTLVGSPADRLTATSTTITCDGDGAVPSSLTPAQGSVACTITVGFPDSAAIEAGDVTISGVTVGGTAAGGTVTPVVTGASKVIGVTMTKAMTVVINEAAAAACTKPANPGGNAAVCISATRGM